MIWCIKTYKIAYVKTQKIRCIIHYVKPTAQLLFKIRFSKGGPMLIVYEIMVKMNNLIDTMCTSLVRGYMHTSPSNLWVLKNMLQIQGRVAVMYGQMPCTFCLLFTFCGDHRPNASSKIVELNRHSTQILSLQVIELSRYFSRTLAFRENFSYMII